jgi:very-short-patch-repair endonuclease
MSATPDRRASRASRLTASPARPSHLEALFALHLRARGITVYTREHRFAPPRKWRFDFAFVDRKLAVECEGATWSAGRHTRGRGFAADCEKYNAAALAGWLVLRFPADTIESGAAADMLVHALKARTTAKTLGEPAKLASLQASPYVSEQPKVASEQTADQTTNHHRGDLDREDRDRSAKNPSRTRIAPSSSHTGGALL